jgi:K+-transporting ATPase ATPase C chain
VASARGVPLDRISGLVLKHTEGRQWGVFGEPRVNVLLLNLELDQTIPTRK